LGELLALDEPSALGRALTVLCVDFDPADLDRLAMTFSRHRFLGCQLAAAAALAPPVPKVSHDALAYLMFTSGSTGTPKAVPISNRNATS
jgi:acyl-CoA synthetase (AMP-forming)/AMP-acid ligase II